MANSQYEYVKLFERNDILLPNTFLVIRIDGHSFHRFSDLHQFQKPNDLKALKLMTHAAKQVLSHFGGKHECLCAYGISDEYSFIFSPKCNTFQRRESKLISTLVSVFTGAYILAWSKYFPDTPLQYAPSFDARAVLYPTSQNIKDYLAWRQVDQHINNLYNTVFWALRLRPPKDGDTGPLNAIEAEAKLSGTVSSDKHDILFKQYGINYNEEPEIYKKGTILLYPSEKSKRKKKGRVEEHYTDIMRQPFWDWNEYILND